VAQNKIRASVLGIGRAREVAAIEMIGLTRKGQPVYRVGDSIACRKVSEMLLDVTRMRTGAKRHGSRKRSKRSNVVLP